MHKTVPRHPGRIFFSRPKINRSLFLKRYRLRDLFKTFRDHRRNEAWGGRSPSPRCNLFSFLHRLPPEGGPTSVYDVQRTRMKEILCRVRVARPVTKSEHERKKPCPHTKSDTAFLHFMNLLNIFDLAQLCM